VALPRPRVNLGFKYDDSVLKVVNNRLNLLLPTLVITNGKNIIDGHYDHDPTEDTVLEPMGVKVM
jgi:hypothetical protein